MPRVRQLPPNLINKIAAGEVVVRPASAVKEMVENSLDAGASQISIEVENGGRDLIVTDNGCGMEREDAEMALQRHATSKIETLDDLMRVQTAGFRGEAVPAMASVSRMRIQTRPSANAAGTLVEVEGGRTLRVESAGAAPGTRIEIRDLFFNVPARRKFLKSPASEFNAIAQIITRLALAHPEVGFSLSRDGRSKMSCRPCESLLERFVQVLGSRYEGALLPLEGRWTLPVGEDENGDAKPREYLVRGAVALPSTAGKDRSKQFFFANGRPIKHRRLSAVLGEAARGFVMSGRHLAAAIFIETPPDELDVNVHPAKEEVRFAREQNVCGLLYRAAQAACAKADLTPKAHLGGDAPEKDQASAKATAPKGRESDPDFLEFGDGSRVQMDKRHLTGEKLREFREIWLQPKTSEDAEPAHANAPAEEDADFESAAAALEGYRREHRDEDEHAEDSPDSLRETPAPFAAGPIAAVRVDAAEEAPEAPEVLSPAEERAREAEAPFFSGPEPKVLGQIGQSYIIAEVGNDALIIDQHAAHERLLYHHFSKKERSRGAQRLLAPVVVDLPAPAAAIADELIEPLAQLGLEIESFGGQTYQITAVPANTPNIDAANLLLDLVQDFERGESLREWRDRRHLVVATLACKAAVKAGQRLSMAEMERLLRDMRAADLPFTCPHGRPTMIRLTRGELDMQFKRR